MYFLYSLLMYLLSPFVLFRLLWKGRRLPAYRQRIAERFMCSSREAGALDVWVHAVSLGEVVAATPLIAALLEKKLKVLVTTMTPTGSERVLTHFGARVQHQYLPYDLPVLMRRFYRTMKPRLGLVMETEMWPNMIRQAKKADIPLLMVNARLSPSSFQGYHRAAFFFKPLLNQLALILAQSSMDAERFVALGADAKRVQIMGNIKFDVQVDAVARPEFNQMKALFGPLRPVLIAASTHHDEEAQILRQLPALQQKISQLVLLIAPRHPERFQTVYHYAKAQGFNTGLRSDLGSLSEDNQVVVIDSLGELMGWYALSDFAFVGGSLVQVGGHNVLEPIAQGVPVITGPHVTNFKSICEALLRADAIALVPDAEGLAHEVSRLYEDKQARGRRIVQARAVLDDNQGALAHCLDQVDAMLNGGYVPRTSSGRW